MSFTEEIQVNLNRAESSLGAAQVLIEAHFYNDAVSRAYYSAFYGATALLLSKEISVRSHSGLLQAIGLNFVKTGLLEKQFGRDLNRLAELRSVGDYGELKHIRLSEAVQAVETAAAFLKEVHSIL
ncbi:MAG: HEPN domain-containing protein, partial [Cyanobacteria bacterium J06649_4]